MRTSITKRVLNELGKKANKASDEYASFWDNFGAVLKEGLYEDADHRDAIIKLLRFRSTTGEELVSLADYIGRIKEGQQAIYYITGEEIESLRRSPQLEGFAARDIEVLLLTDPIDEFWIPAVGKFDDKEFKSVTRAGADLGDIPVTDGEEAKTDDEAEPADPGRIDSLIALFKLTLDDEVKDVRTSERLTDSAACLVADEGDLDIHMERLLKQHRQLDTSSKRILEINPKHDLIRTLAEAVGKDGTNDRVNDAARLVLDQARIIEGEPLPDPAAFSRRLSEALARGLAV